MFFRSIFYVIRGYLIYKMLDFMRVLISPKRKPRIHTKKKTKPMLNLHDADIEDANFKEIDDNHKKAKN